MSAIQPHRAQVFVRTRGWAGLADGLSMMNRQESFLSRQRAVLESLEMHELVGIDAELIPVLRLIPEETSWQEGRNLLREQFHNIISDQVANLGATMFFDVEKMMQTMAAVLVSEIIDRRKKEVDNTILRFDGKNIQTMPLHLTYYGHRLLTTLRIYSSLPLSRLSELEDALGSLELRITISDTDERAGVNMSDDLKQHIFEGQLGIYLISYIKQRYIEERNPVSMSEISGEFKALGFNLSEITLQLVEEQTRGNLIEEPLGHYIPRIQ